MDRSKIAGNFRLEELANDRLAIVKAIEASEKDINNDNGNIVELSTMLDNDLDNLSCWDMEHGDEYAKLLNEVLSEVLTQIPKDFRVFIGNRARNIPTSGNYKDVLDEAQNLIDELRPCIDNYRNQF